MAKTGVVNARVEQSVHDRLQAYCDQRDIKKAVIIEKALIKWLDENESNESVQTNTTQHNTLHTTQHNEHNGEGKPSKKHENLEQYILGLSCQFESEDSAIALLESRIESLESKLESIPKEADSEYWHEYIDGSIGELVHSRLDQLQNNQDYLIEEKVESAIAASQPQTKHNADNEHTEESEEETQPNTVKSADNEHNKDTEESESAIATEEKSPTFPSEWMNPEDFVKHLNKFLGKAVIPKNISDKISKLKPEEKEKTENGISFEFKGLRIERKKISTKKSEYRLLAK